mmetsp:Transcript_36115/g.80740  ORF Transcript_36115/g.80740 Transcript_36115/m.80740 type:complete len:414 (-) Transcript_36115:17-1258(-)
MRCNYGSWLSRGWCRAELWCKQLSTNANSGVIVVQGADDATFLMPQTWIHRPPHKGDFTVESDRHRVMQMLRAALDVHTSNLRKRKKHDLFKFFTAKYTDLLGLADVEQSPEEFITSFGFGSMEKASRVQGMGAVACAAGAGDRKLVRLLLEAKAPLATRGPNMVEVDQLPGQTPLHLAVARGIGSAGVMKELLEARADPNCSCNLGIPLLAHCKDPETVDLLVSYRADVNLRTGLVYNTPLALCCAKVGPAEVVAKMLEVRADPNLCVGGVSNSPLVALAFFTTGQAQYALQVADLLLGARADVNLAQRPSGVWRVAELFCRASQYCGKDSALMRYFAESSTTALGIAAFYGNDPMVTVLLAARADANYRNRRGHTPLMLATKGHTIQLLLQEQSFWKSEQAADDEILHESF